MSRIKSGRYPPVKWSTVFAGEFNQSRTGTTVRDTVKQQRNVRLHLTLHYHRGFIQSWANFATRGTEDLPSLEEVQHVDNLEKEKVTEFLQEKHMSNPNLRAGK